MCILGPLWSTLYLMCGPSERHRVLMISKVAVRLENWRPTQCLSEIPYGASMSHARKQGLSSRLLHASRLAGGPSAKGIDKKAPVPVRKKGKSKGAGKEGSKGLEYDDNGINLVPRWVACTQRHGCMYRRAKGHKGRRKEEKARTDMKARRRSNAKWFFPSFV